MFLPLKLKYSVGSWVIGSVIVLNSVSVTFASVVLDSIDYQMYRDFAENKGKFFVGNTNIAIYDKTGKYRGSLDQAPMPDLKSIETIGAYSTLVHPGYSIGAAHVKLPSSIAYFGDGEVSLHSISTGIINPDENAYMYNVVKVTDYPTYNQYVNTDTEKNKEVSIDINNYRYNKLVTEVAPAEIVEGGLEAFDDKQRYSVFYRAGKGNQYIRKDATTSPEHIANAYVYSTGGTVAQIGRPRPGTGFLKYLYTYTRVDNPAYGPLPSYGAAGDSGSPLLAWDGKEKKWVILGTYGWWDGADYSLSAWSVPPVGYLDGVVANDLQHSIQYVSGSAPLKWSSVDDTKGLSLISQGDASYSIQGFSSTDANAAKNLVFSGDQGKIVLDNTIHQGAGYIEFKDNYTVSSSNGSVWTGAGLIIDEGKTVEWNINGEEKDELHKVGAGTLIFNAVGVNNGDLRVGDGVVILNQTADSTGKKQAFKTLTITSGRPTVVLGDSAQVNPNSIYFGFRGGRLDLNGTELTFDRIRNADAGAQIVNHNLDKVASINIAGVDGDQVFQGMLGETDDSKNNGQLNITYAPSNDKNLVLSGGANMKGNLDIKNGGKVVLSGRPTPHAAFVVIDDDWISSTFKIDKINIDDGGQLDISEYANFTGDIFAKGNSSISLGYVAGQTQRCIYDSKTSTGECKVSSRNADEVALLPSAVVTGNVNLNDDAKMTIGKANYTGKIIGSANSTLNLEENSHWILTGHSNQAGKFSQSKTSLIEISYDGDTQPYLSVESATVGGNLLVKGLSYSDFAKSSDLDKELAWILHSSAAIDGDFDSVDLNGLTSQRDYISVFSGKRNGDKDYVAGFALSWLSGSAKGHGTFTLDNASDVFEVDTALSDVSGTFASGWDGKSLTKAGYGKLILSGNNNYSGKTVVDQGTLQFGLSNKATNSHLGNDVLVHAGALSIQGGSVLNVDGNVTLDKGTQLDIGYNSRSSSDNPMLLADHLIIGEDTTFNLSGVDDASSLDKVLIQTKYGINGDFNSITVGGFSGTVDYLTLNTRKSDDGLQYTATYNLSWTSNNNLAHGTFTLENQSNEFTLGVSLTDQNANPLTGWDGRSLTKKGKGTLILTGANSYSGTTTVEAGTLQIGDGGTSGSIAGDVVNQSRLVFNRSDSFTFAQKISGSGFVEVAGSGDLTLSASNTYTGNTLLKAGVLHISSSDNLGSQTNGLVFDGGTLAADDTIRMNRQITLSNKGGVIFVGASENDQKSLIFDGAIIDQTDTTSGSLTKIGSGTLILNGNNSYRGATFIKEGVVIAGSSNALGAKSATSVVGKAVLDVAGFNLTIGTLSGDSKDAIIRNSSETNNVVFTSDSADNSIFSGRMIDGTDKTTLSFVKNGTGTLILNGNNSYTGLTTIDGGSLIVGDRNNPLATIAGSLVARSGTRLGGYGRIGSGEKSNVTIQSGATIAPGNSVGTLTIDGNLIIEQGARYELEIENGKSDLILVTGRTTINGGSVIHIDEWGGYEPGMYFNILHSGKGVTGRFADLESDYAYIKPSLEYDEQNVYLTFDRNGVALCGENSLGGTHNQINTACGIEGTGALENKIFSLNEAGALNAFNQLSGEMHASIQGMMVDDSRFARDAVFNRSRSAFNGVGADKSSVIVIDKNGAQLADATSNSLVLWTQAFGAWSDVDGNMNAAKTKRSIGGILSGLDTPIYDNSRVGIFSGYSKSSFKNATKYSSANVRSYYVGAYAGSQLGALRLTNGLNYTWNRLDNDRSIYFNNFNDRLNADFKSYLLQVFSEASYQLKYQKANFEPYAQLAYVKLNTNGFTENGGIAALKTNKETMETFYSTLGLRGSHEFAIKDITSNVNFGLGWRHAYGDITPEIHNIFAKNGAKKFNVKGIPIAQDSAVVEAGIDFKINSKVSFGLTYQGLIASKVQDHGFKINFVSQW